MHLNLAAYRFTDLDDLPALRQRLLDAGRRLGVCGTVLLSPEGVNLVVSAPADAARRFAGVLTGSPALAGLVFKESRSDAPSFKRFLVKIKREIITFRQPGCQPQQRPGPRVDPVTLGRWLDRGHDDDGRPVALVDTRNRFEVEVGRFASAIDPGIASFSALPEALSKQRDSLAGKRVVAYCTGGIRCEKAVLWMTANGFDTAVQLDGGVLGYFEAIGGRHWDGELFVFDRRVSLTPALRPGSWTQEVGSRRIRPAAEAL